MMVNLSLVLQVTLLAACAASPLGVPLSAPKNVRRATTSQDPSCPAGFLCVQEDCPSDVLCPSGEVCINFEGAYACAVPGLTWCALNPTTLEGVGCSSGLCCHGNCYTANTVCCDFPDIQCTIGKACNVCSAGQTCGQDQCVGGSSASTTTSVTTTVPPVSTTSTTSTTTSSTTSSTTTSKTTTTTSSTAATTTSTTSTTTSSTTSSTTTTSTTTTTTTTTATTATTTTTSATTVSTSTTAATSTPTPSIISSMAGFNYIGCYADSSDERILVADSSEDGSDTGMSVERCIDLAQDGGWQYAGVEFGSQCFVGNTLHGDVSQMSDSDCSTPCAGNAAELCGDGGRIQIYQDASWYSPTAADMATALQDYQDALSQVHDAISDYQDFIQSVNDQGNLTKRDDYEMSVRTAQTHEDTIEAAEGLRRRTASTVQSLASRGSAEDLPLLAGEQAVVDSTRYASIMRATRAPAPSVASVLADLGQILQSWKGRIAISLTSALEGASASLLVIGGVGVVGAIATGIVLEVLDLIGWFLSAGSGSSSSTTTTTATPTPTPTGGCPFPTATLTDTTPGADGSLVVPGLTLVTDFSYQSLEKSSDSDTTTALRKRAQVPCSRFFFCKDEEYSFSTDEIDFFSFEFAPPGFPRLPGYAAFSQYIHITGSRISAGPTGTLHFGPNLVEPGCQLVVIIDNCTLCFEGDGYVAARNMFLAQDDGTDTVSGNAAG